MPNIYLQLIQMSRKGSTEYKGLKSDEDIVHFIYNNVIKQKRKQFYQGLSTRALEIFICANFSKKQIGYEEGLLVVDLVKKQPFILSIAFERKDFNLKALFGFLDEKITMDKVRALEEMMYPFCKKYPEKVLDMLRNHEDIKTIWFSHLYLRHIFKLASTTVFCLQKKDAQELVGICQEIIYELTRSIFDFSPQKREQQKNKKFIDEIEVVQNLRDFLDKLMENLNQVFIPFLAYLVSLLNEKYIEQIIELFDATWMKPALKDYCQTLIEILLRILETFECMKLCLHRQTSKEEGGMIEEVEDQLLKNAGLLASKMPFFTSLLLQKPQSVLRFSSGQTIQMVGMIRYRILELIQKLLSINQLCNLQISFQNLNFFKVIEFYIINHKWNNITHNLIIKITELIIDNDYNNFKKKYILNELNNNDNIFMHLIQNFRYHKFIFLNSFNAINNGNLCSIYELSKMIVNQMKEKNDLNYLMKHFKIWKEFMENDMTLFQKYNYKEFQLSVQEMPNYKKDSRKKSFDSIRSLGNQFKENTRGRTLETFDQILNNIKESQKWNSADIPESPLRKISVQKSFVQKFDSIGYLESQ